jgi:hypothetical protein
LARDDSRDPRRETSVATDAIHRAVAVVADRNPRERRPRRENPDQPRCLTLCRVGAAAIQAGHKACYLTVADDLIRVLAYVSACRLLPSE